MRLRYLFHMLLLLALVAPSAGLRAAAVETGPVSGKLTDGIRLVRLENLQGDIHLTVYRGDYVRFVVDPSHDGVVLSIPALDVDERLSADPAGAAQFKMKRTGRFPFAVGEVRGVLAVVPFQNPRYREVTSRQAAELIRSANPLVLDVRTRQEYARGHLPDSVLIPVQELAQRVGEISGDRDRQVLIYCATGNRSTVAAKILLEAGFDQVVNMRDGIAGWWQNRLPVVQ